MFLLHNPDLLKGMIRKGKFFPVPIPSRIGNTQSPKNPGARNSIIHGSDIVLQYRYSRVTPDVTRLIHI